MNISDQNEISLVLGYRFENTQLLHRALTHSSTEQPDNENLEFLGDAVLSAVISDYLFGQYPDATAGELTKLRSRIVNNHDAIYSVALGMSLETHVKVGKSFPKQNHKAWRNLLPNTLEALIGAIYLDGGMYNAQKFILDKFRSLIEKSSITDYKDSKSRLQEYLQQRSLPVPTYITVDVSGDYNNPSFTVNCHVDGLVDTATGQGNTKKRAEQDAAAQAYDLLRQHNV
ncbi:MAG: ribonuclease III [Acidiferrobacterales bacterium]|nr:ribonuclease III [Acidiferrobacterales bacterium]